MKGSKNVENVRSVPLGNQWCEDKSEGATAVLVTAATISSAVICTIFTEHIGRETRHHWIMHDNTDLIKPTHLQDFHLEP